jgi:hypothetical protein
VPFAPPIPGRRRVPHSPIYKYPSRPHPPFARGCEMDGASPSRLQKNISFFSSISASWTPRRRAPRRRTRTAWAPAGPWAPGSSHLRRARGEGVRRQLSVRKKTKKNTTLDTKKSKEGSKAIEQGERLLGHPPPRRNAPRPSITNWPHMDRRSPICILGPAARCGMFCTLLPEISRPNEPILFFKWFFVPRWLL